MATQVRTHTHAHRDTHKRARQRESTRPRDWLEAISFRTLIRPVLSFWCRTVARDDHVIDCTAALPSSTDSWKPACKSLLTLSNKPIAVGCISKVIVYSVRSLSRPCRHAIPPAFPSPHNKPRSKRTCTAQLGHKRTSFRLTIGRPS